MLRVRLACLALLASGCFIDAVGTSSSGGGEGSGAGDATGTGASAVGAGQVGGQPSTGGGGSFPVGGAGGGGGVGGGIGAQACPLNQFATGIDSNGMLSCGPIDNDVIKAVSGDCAVHLGWSDNCGSGCSSGPSKYGRVDASTCQPTGQDTTCQTSDLGASLGVQLLGVEMDNNVDDNDRFYAAFSCATGSSAPGACAPGLLVTGYDGTTATCTEASGSILDYVRSSCSVVTGWRDQCGPGCNGDPSKFGSVGTLGCTNVTGGTCATFTLGAETLQVFDYDADGDVGDDDKFYVGLTCTSTTSAQAPAAAACPAGKFVTGIQADGQLVCRALDETTLGRFRQRCSLYFGWRDGCGNCTTTPTKWGQVKDGACSNSGGTDDTCTVSTVAGQPVNLYGLNTDSNVDNNDKFFIGFRCE